MVLDLNILHTKGLKLTKHKITIFRLFCVHKHLDAYQINKILRETNNSISIATIYRILSTFEKYKIITRNNFNEEHVVYELVDPSSHHDHLICTRCNKVIEFYSSQIESIQEDIARKNNFKISSHYLNLYGICSICQNKEE